MADGQADEQPAGRSVLRPVKDDSAFGNPEHDAQFRGRAGIAIKLAELDDEDLLDPRLRRELNRLVPDANWRPGLVSIRCGISRLSASDATTVPVRVGPQVQALPRRPAGAGSSGLARVGGLLAVDDADCTRGRLPLAFLASEGGGAGREQKQLAQAEEALFLCPHDGVAQATPGHGSPPGQNPRAVDSASVTWMTDRPSRVRHDRSQPQTPGRPVRPRVRDPQAAPAQIKVIAMTTTQARRSTTRRLTAPFRAFRHLNWDPTGLGEAISPSSHFPQPRP